MKDVEPAEHATRAPHTGPEATEPAGSDLTDPVDTPESAEPSEATEQSTATSPGPRLSWRLLVPVVMGAAGLMFAMSFQTAQGSDLRADRDLPQLIMAGDARVAEESATLDELQKEVDALSKANAPSDRHLSALTEAADELAGPAATTKVSGPALEVTLDDSKRTADSLSGDYTPDDIVVHQQDVQAVINALWSSGAEAMMVQDQRIISTSAVRCVGNTLILQGRVYAPPYRITAIGDADRLQEGLDADPAVNLYRLWVDEVGLGYGVHAHSSIELPAYSGSVDFQYATPIR